MPNLLPPCTGVILAGGQGKRLNNSNKAFVRLGGQRVLDRILAVFKPLFDEIVLVTNDPIAYLEWDVRIVRDHFNLRSSLTGIHAGLFAACHPHALVVACDMPFIRPVVVQTLLETLEPRWDVVLPATPKGLEPLLAIYSKRCIKPIERQLNQKKLRIQRFFDQVRVKKIPAATVQSLDPDLISFININSPADLIHAEQWLEVVSKPSIGLKVKAGRGVQPTA